ncbi:MAG: molybdenum cofactor guanylyltransferase [Terriglobales bacterium]
MQVAILAGGQSRRMGRDKALAPWRGQPLLAHMIQIAQAAGAGDIVISGAEEKYRAWGRAIPDQGPGGGPLRGMATVLRAAASRVLMLACDLPRMTPEFLRWLWAQSQPGVWTVAIGPEGEVEPLCAVYARELLADMDRALAGGDYKIARALAAAPRNLLTAPMVAAAGFAPEIFRNCNAPGDLE